MIESADDMDLRMERALSTWAEQVDLPLEKSAQLHDIVADLAYREGKKRLTRNRTVWGLAAAIVACIWLLFASCPVAAAAYVGSPIAGVQFGLSQVCALAFVLSGFFLNQLLRSQISKF